MEALTIIAYNQPVSKSFVENVRGVDSSSVVNNLVEKGLVEEAGRLDVPGKPIVYRTTPVFLRTFGLSSIADLPPLAGHENVVVDEEQLPLDIADEDTESVGLTE
jgi:segregation and condensation protein B